MSFINPVSVLERNLPRDPEIMFKTILENGIEVKISANNVKYDLEWLVMNNILYKDINIDNETIRNIEKVSSEAR